MYHLNYYSATDLTSLTSAYSAFINEQNGPSILEIFTPEKLNNSVLLDFFKSL